METRQDTQHHPDCDGYRIHAPRVIVNRHEFGSVTYTAGCSSESCGWTGWTAGSEATAYANARTHEHEEPCPGCAEVTA